MGTYCFNIELSLSTPILIEDLSTNCSSYFSSVLLPINYIETDIMDEVSTKYYMCNENRMEYNKEQEFVYPSLLYGNESMLF